MTHQSLNNKLQSIVFYTVGLSLFLAFFVIVLFEQNNTEKNFNREVENIAKLISRYSITPLLFADKDESLEALNILKGDKRILKAQLLNADNQPMAIYEAIKGFDFSNTDSLFFYQHTIKEDNETLGTLKLWLDTTSQKQQLQRMLITVFIVAALCIVLARFLSNRLLVSISSSVKKITTAFHYISQNDDYTKKATHTSILEFNTLIDSFNHMLEEVSKRDQQISQSRETLELALLGSGEGLWDYNIENKILYADKRCYDILHLNEKHKNIDRLKFWLTLFSRKDRKKLFHISKGGGIDENQHFEIECKMSCGDNVSRWVILHGILVFNSAGVLIRISGTLMDNDERHKSAEDNKILSAIFQNSNEPIVVINDALIVQVNNSALEQYVGGTEQKNSHVATFFDKRYETIYYETISQSLRENREWSGEVALLLHNGKLKLMWFSVSWVVGTENYLGTFTSIEQRKNVEDELRYLANFDSLTDLPNRRLFNTRLNHALTLAKRHNTKFALFFLDLNDFKIVNDSLGHGVGDALLVAVAERLKLVVRKSDTLARFGGDEFIILLDQCGNDEQIAESAQRVFDCFKESFQCYNNQIFTSTSIGIARFPQDGAESEGLIRNADMAMYSAKNTKLHYVFFDQSLSKSAEEYANIKNELSHALSRNQLYITIQPKFYLETHMLHSAEVLLRWQHPEMGMVSPDLFIPIAEASGLIDEIGDWVIFQAAALLGKWSTTSLANFSLAVNVSALQFDEIKLPFIIKKVIKENNLSEGLLELELTESLLLKSGKSSDSILNTLKKTGVSLSIDDFGTGHSSLQYLHQFPVDYLKIDRSFIDGIESKPRNKTIVKAILAMAKGLEMKVIAEGIENIEQLNILNSLGCELGQGYWCSKPLKIDEFEVFFESWQQRHPKLIHAEHNIREE